MASAATSRLPYDQIVHSVTMLNVLGDEKFDVIVDPVGGQVRTESLQLLAPGGRLLLIGNASGEWEHGVNGNTIWQGNFVVAGFNAGGYLPAHPEAVPAAAAAALTAASSGLADTEIELLPLAEAATAHQRLQEHTAQGRIVLIP